MSTKEIDVTDRNGSIIGSIFEKSRKPLTPELPGVDTVMQLNPEGQEVAIINVTGHDSHKQDLEGQNLANTWGTINADGVYYETPDGGSWHKPSAQDPALKLATQLFATQRTQEMA